MKRGLRWKYIISAVSLRLGDTLTPDYEKLYQLAEPFLQGLERAWIALLLWCSRGSIYTR